MHTYIDDMPYNMCMCIFRLLYILNKPLVTESADEKTTLSGFAGLNFKLIMHRIPLLNLPNQFRKPHRVISAYEYTVILMHM